MQSAPAWWSAPHHFLTADVETPVIAPGIAAIAAIRNEVEQKSGMRLPITWFVRFQRSWSESVENDSPESFRAPPKDLFDGYQLAEPLLRRLAERGDEIAWHYHAYNYVHREDLPHEQRVAILHADLAACRAELLRRHGDLAGRSLRFGWFFVPDYGVFATLRALGIRVDASIKPENAGRPVACFAATYLPALTPTPREVDGLWLVPFRHTSLVHDTEVVPHDLGWSRRSRWQALCGRRRVAADLRATARRLAAAGGEFLTYDRIAAAPSP